MLESFLVARLNDASTAQGLDALDEADMLHADLPGHSSVPGAPHGLVLMGVVAVGALLVRVLL